MDYNETLQYIHSVNNYFCKPGLERISELCSFLGDPQDKLRFVHVAGTNGKGSFCAMLTSILKSAGYRVGTYTSPYILEFNERIAVNAQMIPNKDLVEICEYIKPFCEKMQDKPTEFELITAIAFEYFNRQKCDIVVLECGLGGRFDATNIIKNTVLSVITGVDFDHQNFLGNTIEKIADEKAGIIKKGVPCLWCGKNSEAFSVILNNAKDKNAELITTEHGSLKTLKSDLSGTTFDFKEYKSLFLPLLSSYQPLNAANAITAAEFLGSNGFNISINDIFSGLKNSQWKARFELLSQNPVVIFDGSHNPQGVTATVNSIKQYFPGQKVNILSGVMADKDFKFIAKVLSEVANNVYCITPNNPRSLKSDEYSNVFKILNINSTAFENIGEAVQIAVSASQENKIPLICLGSLYMYADIYSALQKIL